jgi:hypothetical protein
LLNLPRLQSLLNQPRQLPQRLPQQPALLPRQKLKRTKRSLPKVLLSRTKKQQLQLLRQHQPSQQASDLDLCDDHNEDFELQEIHVAYRRPVMVDEDGDELLSNHVLDRLQDARELALSLLR